MDKNYYLGLDIGTNSCGWAVTDENYNILKARGKRLWGVRLFDEAQTATDRRVQRSNRRRLDRRKLKLEWLREIFAEEIAKVDDKFLTRMKYSNLWADDKQKMDLKLKSKDSLFNDFIDGEKFTDKEFYQKFKTIHHLRQAVKNAPAEDVRFLYLALHNIIKRRGHFLYEGEMEGEGQDLSNQLNNFISLLSSMEKEEFLGDVALNQIDDEKEQRIIALLRENLGIRAKKAELYKVFDAKKGAGQTIIDALLTGKFKLTKMFNIEKIEDEKDILFDSENFESEMLPIIEDNLSDDGMNVVDQMKKIYNTLQLKKILGDFDYICDAKVSEYETHKEQLDDFKAFIKEFYPSQKSKIFRDENGKDVNYSKYVNGGMVNGRRTIVNVSSTEDRTYESFKKFINSILNSKPEIDEENEEKMQTYELKKAEIQNLLENNSFLVKQRNKGNAVLPNALYVKEVEKILEVNAEKYDFLNKVDESGISNSEKIIQILKFRVPYFVGPIGNNPNAEQQFGWVEKECDLPLRPWNFDKIIDHDKAEEIFITEKTNKCTYCHGEDVLPKNSILYSKYRVLNELNNLKVNGEKLSVKLKQEFFNEVFLKRQKVTGNMVKNFVVQKGLYDECDKTNIAISGIDKDFANNMKSYILFANEFGEDFVNSHIKEIEKVIFLATIIEDKKRLEDRLKRDFATIFSPEQIKRIKGFVFSGWGKLSKYFLEDMQVVNYVTGEVSCFINEMWNNNKNLQELIFDTDYNINEAISEHNREYNKQKCEDLEYALVEESYCSPSVKRGVWQTILIVKDIIKTLGKNPEKVFVEVTRDDLEKGDKGRKLKRKETLANLYASKEFKENINNLSFELDDLMNKLEQKDNESLRSERLYLYFLQLGRCAYSGEKIDLIDLYNEHLYDVDHIIPRAIIKDDSINNKVLVKSTYNSAKSDKYPIAVHFPEWVKNQEKFWKVLHAMKLMDKSKLDRLIRRNAFSPEEEGEFIARQLVETNQSAKAVIEILKDYLGLDRNVIYSKGKFVSEFRKRFGIFKSREVNDLHHAKDAYLNIVVGNVLHNRFTNDPRHFYSKQSKKNEGLTKDVVAIFNRDVYSYLGDEKRIWHGEEDLPRVKEIVLKNDCLVTRMSFVNLNGGFYDETRYKNSNKTIKKPIPLKGDENNPLSNVERYGGYNKAANAYFVVIESDGKKGERKRTIEALPIMVYRKYKDLENKNDKFLEYIAEANDLKNATIVLSKLNYQSTLKIGKGIYILSAKDGDRYSLRNANQWHLCNEQIRYVKAIEKTMELNRNPKWKEKQEEKDGKIVISKASKKGNTEVSISREENIDLYEIIIEQVKKEIYKGKQIEKLGLFLENNIGNFVALSIIEQIEQLFRLVKRLSTGLASADLTWLGGGKTEARISIAKDITKENIALVCESPTGLYSHKIKL